MACGGSGGGPTVEDPPLPPPVAGTATYEYYTGVPTTTSAVGGLFSVSSAAPATPATVDGNAPTTNLAGGDSTIRNATVATGTLDGATGTVGSAGTYAVVFAASGRLWKQYTNQAPAPVQISNTTTITAGLGDGMAGASTTDLCAMTTMPDFADLYRPDT